MFFGISDLKNNVIFTLLDRLVLFDTNCDSFIFLSVLKSKTEIS